MQVIYPDEIAVTVLVQRKSEPARAMVKRSNQAWAQLAGRDIHILN